MTKTYNYQEIYTKNYIIKKCIIFKTREMILIFYWKKFLIFLLQFIARTKIIDNKIIIYIPLIYCDAKECICEAKEFMDYDKHSLYYRDSIFQYLY